MLFAPGLLPPELFAFVRDQEAVEKVTSSKWDDTAIDITWNAFIPLALYSSLCNRALFPLALETCNLHTMENRLNHNQKLASLAGGPPPPPSPAGVRRPGDTPPPFPLSGLKMANINRGRRGTRSLKLFAIGFAAALFLMDPSFGFDVLNLFWLFGHYVLLHSVRLFLRIGMVPLRLIMVVVEVAKGPFAQAYWYVNLHPLLQVFSLMLVRRRPSVHCAVANFVMKRMCLGSGAGHVGLKKMTA
ncbi:hypothetical protein FRC12_015724 [Ceratobasidium sp. 428]|nr:hypothetical protein FRC12_015724 [Ceratobasidium sp. 428]